METDPDPDLPSMGDYEARQRRWREIEAAIGREAMDRVRYEIARELGLADSPPETEADDSK